MAVNFSFYGVDLNSDKAGKYTAAPQAQQYTYLPALFKILRFEIIELLSVAVAADLILTWGAKLREPH